MHSVTCEYVPSSGDMNDKINLLGFPYFISDMSPLFNYSHSVITSYGRIVGFSNSETESRDLVINVATEDLSTREFLKAKDKLFATFEADISARTPGTLYVNGYALRCYFVAEDVVARFDEASQSTFTVIWDQRERWRKDLSTVHFSSGLIAPEIIDPGQDVGSSGGDGSGEIVMADPTMVSEDKATPYGYNYGYPIPGTRLAIENLLNTAASFRLTMNGPWRKPTLWIGDNLHRIKADLESGDYVTIDGTNRSVTWYHKDSITNTISSSANWFMYLDKSQNPFGTIPVGDNVPITFPDTDPDDPQQAWDGVYNFYLTLVDERVCPAWI